MRNHSIMIVLMSGVRADQLLLRDLLLDRLKIKRSGRESRHGAHQIIDEITNSLTINWFLSLFHSALPFQVRLYLRLLSLKR